MGTVVDRTTPNIAVYKTVDIPKTERKHAYINIESVERNRKLNNNYIPLSLTYSPPQMYV